MTRLGQWRRQSKKVGGKMTLQLIDVLYVKSLSRLITARCVHSAEVSIKEEDVDNGLFRILLNLLSFNQETNSLMSEELCCCDKKNDSEEQQSRELMANTSNVMFYQ